MYLSDAIAVIVRRWWLVLLGAVLTVGGAIGVFSVVATQYQATGQVLLLPPSARITGDEEINPYLNLPDGLTLTAALLASHAAGLDTQTQLESEGFESSYLVSVLPGTGPLISVSVNDNDPREALDQRDRLITLITERLAKLQADEAVAESQLIKARDVTSASDAEVLAGARLRAASVIGIAGVIVTLVCTFGFDRFRLHRRVAENLKPIEAGVGPQLVVLADALQRADHVAKTVAPGQAVTAASGSGSPADSQRVTPPGSSRPRRMRPPLPVATAEQPPPASGQRGFSS